MKFPGDSFGNGLDGERAVTEEEGQVPIRIFSNEDRIFRSDGQSCRWQDLVPLGTEGNREIMLDTSFFLPTESLGKIGQFSFRQLSVEIVLLA